MIILFSMLCGLMWCWRGYSKPEKIHGYFRAFLTSLVIIGTYCFLFEIKFNIIAILILTLVESGLGYGKSCEDIDNYAEIYRYNLKNLFVAKKERFCYLGLIGLSYYLLPGIFLGTNLVISLFGFLIFPGAKLLQIKYRMLKTDTWKIVEFMIGAGFVLLCIK